MLKSKWRVNYIIKLMGRRGSPVIILYGQPLNHDYFLPEMLELAKDHQVSALFNYLEFAKLNAEGISKLYRNLFIIYFYNPKNSKKLMLEMSEPSARSGVKVLEIMSKSTWL